MPKKAILAAYYTLKQHAAPEALHKQRPMLLHSKEITQTYEHLLLITSTNKQ
jgi:hypothetical protein